MFERLLNWYNSRKLRRAERIVRSYEKYSADLAHEIIDLKGGSPVLESLYDSVQCSLQIERNKLSRLQQKCEHNEPVRQSS